MTFGVPWGTQGTPGAAKVEVRAAKKAPGQVSQVDLSVRVMEIAANQPRLRSGQRSKSI